MEPVIVVEVLGRRGQVVERIRVDDLPFAIGRGYASDLILDDRWVSPLHATIERDEEGALWLRDADSENGVELTATGAVVDRVPLDKSVRVELGHTSLRLRLPDHPVDPALPLVRVHPVRAWLTTDPMAALLVGALLVACTGYEQWRVAVDGLDPAALVRELLGVLLLVGAWAGAWSLVGRLLIHAARFTEQWIAIAAGVVGTSLLTQILDYGRFLFSSVSALQRFAALASGLLFAGVLYWQLGAATALVRRRRATVAGLAMALWFGFSELEAQEETGGWLETLPYWSHLKPVDPDWLPVESVDAFFARGEGMREWLSDAAKELEAAEAREAARRATRLEGEKPALEEGSEGSSDV